MIWKAPLCILSMFMATSLTYGLSLLDNNRLSVNGINFGLELFAEQRIGESGLHTLSFSPSSASYADSITFCFAASEMTLNLCFKRSDDYLSSGWQATATATYHNDLLLRQLNLNLLFDAYPGIEFLSGVPAINSKDSSLNRNITPYSDKAVAYVSPDTTFWLVASNLQGCYGVETITANQIRLYDFTLHYFRQYTGSGFIPRDCLKAAANQQQTWSWMLFEAPLHLLEINRWPSHKQAALAITNDAESETSAKIAALYLGSNNPANPKYGLQGLIPKGLKVTNAIFGSDEPELRSMLSVLMESGSSIAYHTFENTQDAPGSNAQALLYDLQPYNVRLWTDHSVTNNPECLGYNGLEPSSSSFIGDIIEQSSINYAWMNDGVPTNPFDAFSDPWRLPHRLSEMETASRPLWFFGRTRALTWEFLNGNITLDMKHVMTRENLDKLIQDKGLHISYTNFFQDSSVDRKAFFTINDNGDYEILPEAEEMFALLAFYRDNRGLWIDTAEHIFDRMLAIEQVKVMNTGYVDRSGLVRFRLQNFSSVDIPDFEFTYKAETMRFPILRAGIPYVFNLDGQSEPPTVVLEPSYFINYRYHQLYLQSSKGEALSPTKIELYNLRGQKLFEVANPYPAEIITIPFSAYASGVYFAVLHTDNNRAIPIRFVVVK